MELTGLREVLAEITDQRVDVLVQTIIEGLDRLIETGLPYLHLNRETPLPFRRRGPAPEAGPIHGQQPDRPDLYL